MYRRIWNGVTEFAKTDPDVISMNLELQVNKVVAGHYAYLLGESSTSFYFSKNCDVTTIPERMFRNTYSIALPNNSPYTLLFSER